MAERFHHDDVEISWLSTRPGRTPRVRCNVLAVLTREQLAPMNKPAQPAAGRLNPH